MRSSFLIKFPSRSLRALIRGQEGSAIIEFIIYALPLFVPLVIYLTSVNESSKIHYEARNFARQLARAYVTSPSQDLVEIRMSTVLEVFVKNSFNSNKIESNPKVEVICNMNPCLTPGGKVSIKVALTSTLTGKSTSATAIQTVDAWRDN